jgi:undecaprenyl-diphosphatase
MVESLDQDLFLFLNTAFATPALDAFFGYITQTSHWYLPLAIAALLALVRFERRGRWGLGVRVRDGWRVAAQAILLAGLAVAITDPFCQRILKPLFGRLRPCDPRALVEGGRFLLGHRRSLAMPSIHAANVFGMATVLTWFRPRWWAWFVAPAVLVGLSRIYLGVHYPADVLVGALVGAAVGSAIYWVWRSAVCSVWRAAGRRSAVKGPESSIEN